MEGDVSDDSAEKGIDLWVLRNKLACFLPGLKVGGALSLDVSDHVWGKFDSVLDDFLDLVSLVAKISEADDLIDIVVDVVKLPVEGNVQGVALGTFVFEMGVHKPVEVSHGYVTDLVWEEINGIHWGNDGCDNN